MADDDDDVNVNVIVVSSSRGFVRSTGEVEDFTCFGRLPLELKRLV